MRETAETKGRRYLTEGRVVVRAVGHLGVLATVRGSGAEHRVTHTTAGWDCTCPARTHCSHLVAVGLVTAPTTTRPETA